MTEYYKTKTQQRWVKLKAAGQNPRVRRWNLVDFF